MSSTGARKHRAGPQGDGDKTIFEALLGKADVLSRTSPGVMEKLGFGWDSLHARSRA